MEPLKAEPDLQHPGVSQGGALGLPWAKVLPFPLLSTSPPTPRRTQHGPSPAASRWA